MKINGLLDEFYKDIKELEESSHPIDYCDNCGRKKRLTFDGDHRFAYCNNCWKLQEEIDEKMRKEYGY